MQYNLEELWFSKWYKWSKDYDAKERASKIKEIIDLCACNLGQIEDLVKGKFDLTEKSKVEYVESHIRFPILSFNQGGIPYTCKIAINPCIAYEGNTRRHSKIWVMISSEAPVEMGGLKEFFNFVESSFAEKIEENVKSLYVPIVGGAVPVDDSYKVTMKNAGMDIPMESDLGRLMRRENLLDLIKRDSVQSVLSELRGLSYEIDADVSSVTSEVTDQSDINWRVIQDSKDNQKYLMYGVVVEEMFTKIVGLANFIKDKSKLHDMMKPMAIQMANSA